MRWSLFPRAVLADPRVYQQGYVMHHRPESLEAEMLRHHYALQALLYAVALHRFLRWRLPGYEPERHLAGVVLDCPWEAESMTRKTAVWKAMAVQSATEKSASMW